MYALCIHLCEHTLRSTCLKSCLCVHCFKCANTCVSTWTCMCVRLVYCMCVPVCVSACLWECSCTHTSVLSSELPTLPPPLCTSAWGSSRCCSNIPHSLQKIKQTNEKLTPLLARDAPKRVKPPSASPSGADGRGSRAHLGPWRQHR